MGVQIFFLQTVLEEIFDKSYEIRVIDGREIFANSEVNLSVYYKGLKIECEFLVIDMGIVDIVLRYNFIQMVENGKKSFL